MNDQANGQTAAEAATDAELNGETLVRRRHSRRLRREPRAQVIWRRHHWELLWGTALVGGAFLAFGPLARWITPGAPGEPGEPVDLLAFYLNKIVTVISSRIDSLAVQVWTFVLLTNWAIKLGYLLLAFAVIAIPLRARWWLLHESTLLRMRCPRCGSKSIHRVHRRAWERVVAKIVPVRRYRCSDCHWQGVRIDSDARGLPRAAFASSPRD